MFPENLVQACFQQIQTVYKPKKRKNATAKAIHLTTTVRYDGYPYDDYADYGYEEGPTTAVSLNLTEEYERSLKYADGINVLG